MGTLLPRVVAVLVTLALVAGPATAAPAEPTGTTPAPAEPSETTATTTSPATTSPATTSPASTTEAPRCDAVVDEPVAGEVALEELGDALEQVADRNDVDADDLADTLEHDDSLHVAPCGELFYVDTFRAPDHDTDATHEHLAPGDGGDVDVAAMATSTQDVFTLQSRPGAPRTIYLDADGHTLTNTFWNDHFFKLPSGTTVPPFDLDGSPTTFSALERDRLRQVWARAAEDFAPFDVNVTMQDPGPGALTRSSSTDQTYGVRVVITPDAGLRTACNCAGVATLGTFDRSIDHAYTQVAFVLPTTTTSAQFMAMAVSHEVGHTLGLEHHGVTGGTGYYSGHGQWAPIMGSSSRPLEQWSRGEYPNADRSTQADLTVMTTRGLPLRSDDHGDEPASATPLTLGQAVAGVIERPVDRDVFAFTTPAGAVPISVETAPIGPNLDVKATVLDGSGTVIATLDPPLGSAIDGRPVGLDATGTPTLPEGTFYLRVEGTGFAGTGLGTPKDVGYSEYGSLGAYTVRVGTPPPGVQPAALPVFPAGVPASTQLRLGDPGAPATFAVTAGSLPAGLSLRADGLLSGTPVSAGTSPVTITATDGEGASTSRAYTATVTGLPSPVTSTQVTQRANGVLRVTWPAPPTSTLAPRSGYRVLVGGTPVTTVSAATTQLDLSGLAVGTRHTIEVRARNASGEVDGPVVSGVPIVAPAAPTSLTTTRGDRTLALSWPAVTSTAAAPVTGYRVFVDGVQVHQGTGRSHTLTGLSAGRSYVVTVRAVGPVGTSPARSRTVTAVTKPAAPTSLTVTRRDRALALSWPAVSSTTAAPVTGYRVLVDGRQVHQGTGRSFTVTGLQAGTSYQVSVVAYGPGGVSARRSSTRTAITVPNAQGTVRVTPRSTSAVVSWSGVTSTTARPVTGYQVLVDGRVVATVSSGTRSTTVTGLRRATRTTIAVRPRNTAGTGRATSVTTTTLR